MRMNNNMERTVTTIIGTTSEEESHWGRLIVLVPSGWMCENVLPIFLTEATALNILKSEITRYNLMGKQWLNETGLRTQAALRNWS